MAPWPCQSVQTHGPTEDIFHQTTTLDNLGSVNTCKWWGDMGSQQAQIFVWEEKKENSTQYTLCCEVCFFLSTT